MGLGKEIEGSHYSILSSIGSYILTIVLCVLPVAAFAAWGSSAEIISGTWGSGDDQFGIRYEDTSDMFPRFTITSEGKIVVRDGINRRLKVYTGIGGFETIIPYRAGRKYTELTLADSYGFSGDFVGYGEGGANYFYRADQKVYINFTPTGQLIKTSTTRPLELGEVKRERLGEKRYRFTITYPDKTYVLSELPVPYRRFIRDTQSSHINIVSLKSVQKFSHCGKKLGDMSIADDKRKVIQPEGGGFEEISEILEQYGEPVIAPNGDVYTWKRTPEKYFILKWTWKDDPNVPTGPDAPTGLSVSPSINGLYLTWTASPNDPGCVTGYEVVRATSAGGVFSTIATVEKGVVKYNDTSAEAGTTYYYKVRAKAGTELSPYTAEVSGKR